MKPRSAFSLIELLVVVAILGILAVVVTPAVGSALGSAARTREFAAARNLTQAYLLHAYEHRGRLLPGYADEAAADAEGAPVHHPANARYPWRLAPYLGHSVESTFNLNGLLSRRNGETRESYLYRVSLYPALGMNIFFVGGDMSGNSGGGIRPIPAHEALFGPFAATRLSQVESPSRLLVFASARHRHESENRMGYFKIEAPFLTSGRWQDWTSRGDPSRTGFVDLRHRGRAVAAFLDGSTRLLDETELRDMRHWAPYADRPDWTLQRIH